ncbi:MAG: phosphoribosylformylglycinamidine cyclo-ligase [Alphaproteobacteria bacterium]|nr:phosphoribosylformylglycinamidine cyclo-ligase [Alphaproteobacteria bacterium]
MEKKDSPKSPLTYRDAGVDIDAGDALVSTIKPFAKKTMRAGANPDLGGFGGLFDLKAAGFKDPILVAATDGVGTKLELAQQANMHHGLGIDLVAMCANDILAQGAMPLFFLDYFATGHLAPKVAAEIIEGIADGCVEARCALIGGETAEMPGIYPAGSYDLAGFCVGAAERGTLLRKDQVSEGDKVIALASSGVHANGFSLVRKLIERDDLKLMAPAPFAPSVSLAEALLAPTRIYTDTVKAALAAGRVTSVSHITGGGLIENPPRVYGDNLAMRLDMTARPAPALFKWLKQEAALSDFELARTFNCGIGLLITTPAKDSEKVLAAIDATGEPCWLVGEISARTEDAIHLDKFTQAFS